MDTLSYNYIVFEPDKIFVHLVLEYNHQPHYVCSIWDSSKTPQATLYAHKKPLVIKYFIKFNSGEGCSLNIELFDWASDPNHSKIGIVEWVSMKLQGWIIDELKKRQMYLSPESIRHFIMNNINYRGLT